jgi:hypothetical protein
MDNDSKSRQDHIEEQLKVLAQGHLQFQEEYRQLIKGLELLNRPVQKTTEFMSRLDEEMAKLAAAQRYADEKLAALLVTVKQFRGTLRW